MSITFPKIMGHRGVAGLAPENTLGGFRKTAELGIQWVELDVTLLGDGTPVVNHDNSIDRCSNRQGLLRDMRRTDLAGINNAALFPDWPEEPLPPLSEVLALLTELNLGLNLEIKDHGLPVDKVVAAIDQVLKASQFPLKEKLIISCFNPKVLACCYRQTPEYVLGMLFDHLPNDWQSQAQAVNAFTIHCNWKHLSYQQTKTIKQAGYPLICWTANDPTLVTSLWHWGVDAIISDTPQLFNTRIG